MQIIVLSLLSYSEVLKLPLLPQGQVNRSHLTISSLFALGVHYFPENLWLTGINQK